MSRQFSRENRLFSGDFSRKFRWRYSGIGHTSGALDPLIRYMWSHNLAQHYHRQLGGWPPLHSPASPSIDKLGEFVSMNNAWSEYWPALYQSRQIENEAAILCSVPFQAVPRRLEANISKDKKRSLPIITSWKTASSCSASESLHCLALTFVNIADRAQHCG